jgi:hypothetical protein
MKAGSALFEEGRKGWSFRSRTVDPKRKLAGEIASILHFLLWPSLK